MYTLHVYHRGDLYEVAMREFTVMRISKYTDGSNRRQEVEWEDLSDEVRKLIIQAVKEYNA